MPVLPLITVTLFAGFGQLLAGVDAYAPRDWDLPLRVLTAAGIAIGLEMIAVYVQWHAHDALLLKATATAARLRRVSYLIAGAVALFQYSHFAGPGGAPTPAAIVFAAFSASSPWLWGLHTRRAQHLQLLREGHADAGGATFSAERWRAFPLRTWKARRWSIDHSVTNPREAWEGARNAGAKTPPSATSAAPLVVAVDETPSIPVLEPARAAAAAAMVRDITRHSVRRAASTQSSARAAVEPQTFEEMVAAGWGRGRIADRLGISPSEARARLEAARA